MRVTRYTFRYTSNVHTHIYVAVSYPLTSFAQTYTGRYTLTIIYISIYIHISRCRGNFAHLPAQIILLQTVPHFCIIVVLTAMSTSIASFVVSAIFRDYASSGASILGRSWRRISARSEHSERACSRLKSHL